MSKATEVNLEQICLEIILASGNARGYLLESMEYLKPRNEEKIKELFELARVELNNAHRSQTALLSKEANGEDIKMTVLLVHAQDHLMTTITIRDLVEKFVEVL
ncbi:PTS lactose/cellobiose transporter subunit IIA [Neobacillus sp. 3P2-tot-E-2]|uniref:PTS lactose/cellobiose transporter subunit IIA n=1 Tax=Neobacillus sp. 3P2-tot-E-2 TaxID=3132212 RepID=UPI0039A27379